MVFISMLSVIDGNELADHTAREASITFHSKTCWFVINKFLEINDSDGGMTLLSINCTRLYLPLRLGNLLIKPVGGRNWTHSLTHWHLLRSWYSSSYDECNVVVITIRHAMLDCPAYDHRGKAMLVITLGEWSRYGVLMYMRDTGLMEFTSDNTFRFWFCSMLCEDPLQDFPFCC